MAEEPPEEPMMPAVGMTALGVAQIRADESQREDRLFADPFAAEFLAAAGGSPWTSAGELSCPWMAIVTGAVVRTRFFDDYLLEACASGCRQVVLLAMPIRAGGRLHLHHRSRS